MDYFKKATNKYVALDKKYKEYIGQFFTRGLNGECLDRPQKILAGEYRKKIKKMKQEVDVAHSKWKRALKVN